MTNKIYQVDAFTDTLFKGNPAAVCILTSWLDDQLMQTISSENNLSETVFVVPSGSLFEIRWFTPAIEVDLCGHATLAAAYVLFHIHQEPGDVLRFISPRSGMLTVVKKGDMLYLDFPTNKPEKLFQSIHATIENCIHCSPVEVYKGKGNYIVVLENETMIRNVQPDFNEIARLDAGGLIITATGDHVDFVSRFFAPKAGVNEDPVTGSAHTSLIPLWYQKTGKKKMLAHQLSKRGGELHCELREDRCIIGGQARLYLTGEINLK